jgi:RluA family pseudouridine synthase
MEKPPCDPGPSRPVRKERDRSRKRQRENRRGIQTVKRYTVNEDWRGSRVDRFVRAVAGPVPFATIQLLFRKGRILLNGRRTHGGARLAAGDTVEVDIERVQSRRAGMPGAEEMIERYGRIGEEIEIIYEDGELLALDKPGGLVVQPGNRKERGSLLDLLEEYRLRSGGGPAGGDFPAQSPGAPEFPYSPVHRLDRETSGILIVAKSRSSARALSAAFKKHATAKLYLAVTDGVPDPREGTIRSALRTLKGRSSRSVVDRRGKRAETTYSLLERLEDGRALVEVRIETGRTHQIRAHLASIGAPVSGDRRYGSAGPRLLLHAWMVRIAHPLTGEEIELTAKPPPGFGSEQKNSAV